MSAKNLRVDTKAEKSIKRFPQNIRERFALALISIKENPLIGPKLAGELAGYRKFRIGDYRIVYKFDPKKSTVEIVKIERRGGVYR